MAVTSKPVPTTMALSSTTKLVDAAAALSRLSEASEDGGHEKARDSPSADPSPPAAEPIPAKPNLTAKHLVTPTISPSDPKPKPVPTPPVPDPPATRLLRTLLGDAVPPEPPTSTTSGLATTAWWRRVVEALYNHKRRQTVRPLDSLQREALRAVSKKASASSEEAIPELWESFTSMGLSDADVRLALAWILAAAPIIIHVNLSKTLKHFLKDTHYRNQFEYVELQERACMNAYVALCYLRYAPIHPKLQDRYIPGQALPGHAHALGERHVRRPLRRGHAVPKGEVRGHFGGRCRDGRRESKVVHYIVRFHRTVRW